jgi:hypothetical protein
VSATVYATQYQSLCLVPHPDDTADTIIQECRAVGAIRLVDGEEFVVQLRDDVGPELWTEDSLRRSLPTA